MFRALFQLILILILIAGQTHAIAEDSDVAPGALIPFPRIVADGPAGRVKSVAFAHGGKTLYAAGWDKLIYRWDLVNGLWESRPDGMLTVPVGGGMDGIIEAMAISPDGNWMAAGGLGVKRKVADSRQSGLEMSAEFLSDDQRLDEGTIYLFHLPTGQVKLLRGHRGAILGLKFAVNSSEHLISVAESWNDKTKSFQTDLIGWNTTTGETVGQLLSFRAGNDEKPLPPWDGLAKPPGLVAFTSEDGRLLAAIAWPDQKQEFGLRLWEVSQGRTSPIDNSRQHFYFDVDVDPSRPRDLLTCSASQVNGHGVIRRWPDVAATGKVSSAAQMSHDFGMNLIPSELVSEKIENETFGAVILVQWENKQRVLRGMRITENRGVSAGEIPLNSSFAFIAVSPSGLIAWSALDEPGVHVGRELNVDKPQFTLSSPVTGFQNVEFVTRDGHPGLLLKPRNPAQVPLIFSPNARSLSSDTTGWQPDTLEESIPNVSINSRLDEDRQVLSIDVQRSAASHRVRITSDDESAKFSENFLVRLLHPETEKPLLLVAFNQRSQPHVQVYDLVSGEKLREYSAHTGTIRDLSIQKNGKLFATVSSDATVRLCWLGDLIERKEVRGALRHGNQQLKLSLNAQQLVAVEMAMDPLQKGDVIQTIDIGSGPQVVKTPHDCFYLASQVAPETEVTIMTQRGPQKVRLGSAVDIQRELLAIACSSAPKEKSWDWIAWHPSGTYDFQGLTAKSWLHWHFNTGEAARPSQIARAEKYDQEFLRTDFLASLWETGAMPKAQPAPPPKISLWIQNSDGNPIDDTRHGLPFLRSSRDLNTGLVNIESDSPALLAEGIHWSLLDSSEKILAQGDAVQQQEHLWSFQPKFDLSQSGRYTLTVSVIRGGHPHPTWNRSLDLRYQNPAPQLDVHQIPPVTDLENLPLTITVKSSQESILRLTPKSKTEPIEQLVAPGEQSVEMGATLELGLNEFELTVTNRNALPGYESFERSRKVLAIVRTPSKPVTQQFELLSWTMDSYNPVDLKSTESAVRIRTDSQEIKAIIGGKVTPDVSFEINGTPQPEKVEGDGPFEIRDTIKLKSGINQLRVRAGNEVLGTVNLLLAPDLPVIGPIQIAKQSLTQDEAAKQWPLEVLVDGLHAPKINIQSLATGTFDPSQHRTHVLLDGKVLPEITVKVTSLNDGQNRLSADLEVPAGGHRIQIQVSDDLESETSSAVMIQRITPPRLLKLTEVNREGSKVFAKLEFDSAPESTVTADQIRISVNGNPVPISDQLSIVTESERTIAQVSFQADSGQNNIVQSWLEQDERRLTVPASLEVRLPAASGKTPVIEVDAPGQTTKQNPPIGLRIRSEVPVHTIQIGTDVDSMIDIPQKYWKKSDGLVEILKQDFSFQVEPGVNQILVLAENEYGVSRSTATVSYVRSPISSGHLSFSSHEKSIGFFDSERHFGQVPISQNRINGEIRIPNQDLSNNHVQVWINGFLQLPTASLKRNAGSETYGFITNVTLTRQKRNYVWLHFPENVKLANDFRRDFTVDCERPMVTQKLVVLMMAPAQVSRDERPRREEELKQRLRAALKARSQETRVSSDAFESIDDNIVLLDKEATWSKLKVQLMRIKSDNPVVLLYYQGHELALPNELNAGTFGLTTYGYKADRSQPINPETLVTEKELTKVLSDIGGAHLLILDLVDSNQPAAPVSFGRDPRLGVFRFVKKPDQPSSVVDELAEALSPKVGNDRDLKNVRQLMETSIRRSGRGFPEFHVPPALERLRLATTPE